MDQLPRAFVIMPFEIEFTSIYEKLIKQPLEEAGYQVERADSLLDQHNILSGIVRGITHADLIVADLTTNNPNVFYELGLCHGLRKPTVLIAQSLIDVPFDLRSYNILVYDTHFNKIKKLKDRLKEIGKKHQNEGITFGSPIIDFSPYKHSIVETGKPQVSECATPEVNNEVGQNELLDYLAGGEAAANDLSNILSQLLKDNEMVTSRINRHATSMQTLSNSPVAGSAGKFHKISLLAASDINSFSKKVENILPHFENAIDRLDENYSGFINIADSQNESMETLKTFSEAIEVLLDVSKSAQTGMHSYRNSVLELGEKRISKDLSRATRRQAEALTGVISNLERVEAFCMKLRATVINMFGTEQQLRETTAGES